MEFYQNPEFKGTDYDGSTKPKFSDLPIEIVFKILDELDPINRIFVRYVSKPLRAIVDNLEYPVAEIEVHETAKGLEIIFDNTQKVTFSPTKNGCEAISETQRRVVQGGNYLELALNLLESILSNPRLRLYTLVFAHHHDAKVFNYCINTLASNKKIPKINTKELAIFAFKPVILEPILSLVSHEELMVLRLEAADEPTIEEVMTTELFKTVPGFDIYKSAALGSKMIVWFASFSYFAVKFHRFTTNDILDLRDDLSYIFTSCEYGNIYVEESFDLDDIAAIVDEEIQENKFIIYRHQIPRSEFRLEFKFERNVLRFVRSKNSLPLYIFE
ncbi:hypothetical protein CAEBREN_22211 [Caenorhabditis brenneri]|uniref:F-box domain-containing protein n=1 Tax=Caenorhabditis brenneri TaxID=135651 RepID=G0MW03_CAEBE|nr:hypothetical protein CAEBREN_22211 [Caenorhabditis brenneri]